MKVNESEEFNKTESNSMFCRVSNRVVTAR